MTRYFVIAVFRVDIDASVGADLDDHAVDELITIASGQGDAPPVIHRVLVPTPEVDQVVPLPSCLVPCECYTWACPLGRPGLGAGWADVGEAPTSSHFVGIIALSALLSSAYTINLRLIFHILPA